MAERIYVFKRFERFWHWSQAGLIIFLMLTAFDIHGTYTIFGFEKAVAYHTIAAWSLIGLWVFAIFWHFTTADRDKRDSITPRCDEVTNCGQQLSDPMLDKGLLSWCGTASAFLTEGRTSSPDLRIRAPEEPK
jgi:thiosulfate reductase cytochrome b subunit